ncbi:MAG TPA: hypothetical protein PKE40_04440 [Arachnia sp.]|mgnify:CR=1 FL=1|nr:hypothetical protein [Arachnia sp.]HMT85581.1 hypothetical protein [Arachnia sp.]
MTHAATRREILYTSAWAVPVIAAGAATPLAAATVETVDLTSRARIPNETRSGTTGGLDQWTGPRNLTFTYDYFNNGPATLLAGATVSIGLPFAAIWDTDTMTATLGGTSLTLLTTSTESFGSAGNPEAFRRWWDFALPVPLAPGGSVTVEYAVHLNGTSNAATQFYQVRTVSDIAVGASGATENILDNNRDFSDVYIRFNPS